MSAIAPAPEKKIAPPAKRLANSPFELMNLLNTEMDRLFGDVGFGKFFAKYPFFEGRVPYFGETLWSPDVEVRLHEGKFLVHTDLPGLTKENVTIDVSDGMLTITGERKETEERKKEGYYKTERSYGKFCRNIVLPEGAKPETAKATFTNGVLEIAINVPEPPKPAVHHVAIEGK
jgi:HSP20 family protein